MQAGRIDIALTYRGAAPHSSFSVDLLSEQLVLVGGGKAQAVSPPEVLQKAALMKLVLPSRIDELRAIIDRVSRKRGVTPIPEIELELARSGKGASSSRARRSAYDPAVPLGAARG